MVYRGTWSGADVAIKQCNLNVGEEGIDDFKREAILLLSLRPHPNIVRKSPKISFWVTGTQPCFPLP